MPPVAGDRAATGRLRHAPLPVSPRPRGRRPPRSRPRAPAALRACLLGRAAGRLREDGGRRGQLVCVGPLPGANSARRPPARRRRPPGPSGAAATAFPTSIRASGGFVTRGLGWATHRTAPFPPARPGGGPQTAPRPAGATDFIFAASRRRATGAGRGAPRSRRAAPRRAQRRAAAGGAVRRPRSRRRHASSRRGAAGPARAAAAPMALGGSSTAAAAAAAPRCAHVRGGGRRRGSTALAAAALRGPTAGCIRRQLPAGR
jgi:hypothetical protein